MSLGPQLQQEEQGFSKFDRVQFALKKSAKSYFENPLHYLFYGTLTLAVLGLFVGMEFSWQFYVLLGSLGAVQSYRFFFVEKDSEVKKD